MKISFEEFAKFAEMYHTTGRNSRNKEIEVLETANRVAGERIRELEEKNEKLKERVDLLSLESADFDDRWLKEQDKIKELEKQLEQYRQDITPLDSGE